MTDIVALRTIFPAFADLVSGYGWSLSHCTCDPSGTASAAITKNGVILAYSAFRANRDCTVKLRRPVHPTVKLHAYSSPNISKILRELDIQRDGPEIPWAAIDQNVSRIKAYLTNESVFRRDVREAAERTSENYRLWLSGPDDIRALAHQLAADHPWLVTGEEPALSDVTWTKPSAIPSRRITHGVVMAALGVGLLLNHCMT